MQKVGEVIEASTQKGSPMRAFFQALQDAQLEREKKDIDAAVVRDREFSTGELDYEPD